MKYVVSILMLGALLVQTDRAQAAFQGKIEFTDQEKIAHLQDVVQIETIAAACLDRSLKHHQDFYTQYGISPYYGAKTKFAAMNRSERRADLVSLGKNPDLVDQMHSTSCVGLTMQCLGEAFNAVGENTAWAKLSAYTVANGVDGQALQDGLQKLGWKILFWDPDVSQNAKWDAEERAANPSNKSKFWGFHQERYLSSSRHHRYLDNYVDDATFLINFGTQVPAAILPVPFFVGTAHGGYHVFPGSYGQIIEGHSTRELTDPKTIQTAPFNPLGGGGPTDGEYRSGLIAVPPGTIL